MLAEGFFIPRLFRKSDATEKKEGRKVGKEEQKLSASTQKRTAILPLMQTPLKTTGITVLTRPTTIPLFSGREFPVPNTELTNRHQHKHVNNSTGSTGQSTSPWVWVHYGSRTKYDICISNMLFCLTHSDFGWLPQQDGSSSKHRSE